MIGASKRKIGAFLLAVSMTLSFLAGCGKDSETSNSESSSASASEVSNVKNFNETGLPIVNEKVTLKFMAGTHALQGMDWSDKLVWTETEKLTNVHIEWDLVPLENLSEKKNLLLASGDLPDAFFGGGLTASDLITYGSQGAFIALNDLAAKYSPNITKLMTQYPEIKKGITTPDGKIYSYPKISTNPAHRTSRKWFFKNEWVEKSGMKLPETTDELYNLLKAFKEKDMNGNGESDEIPLTASDMGALLAIFKGPWGLANKGSMVNGDVDVDKKSGELRFVPIQPEYLDMLKYLRKLYEDKLLDNELFTNNTSIISGKISKDTVGAFININTSFAGNDHEKFVGAEAALKGPNGDQLHSAVIPFVQVPAAFVITKNCEYPEVAARFGDFFYDGEGALLYWLGIEGDTYTKNSDGQMRLTEWYTKNPDGLALDEAKGKDFVSDYTNHPIVREEKFAYDTGEGAAEVIDASKKLKPYLPEEVWPALFFTNEENSTVVSIKADMEKYVNDMAAQFIAGKVSFDKWDEYVENIKKMGLDEYMEIFKTALDRYNK